jgi:hypothetical protein
MKLCKDERCRRKGQLLPLTDFAVNNAVADGRYRCCMECARRFSREYRQRLKRHRVPNLKAIKVQRKPCTIMGKVKYAIEQGHRTREAVQQVTKLNEDQIGDALARLWFDRGELESRVVNGERCFFIRRAA